LFSRLINEADLGNANLVIDPILMELSRDESSLCDVVPFRGSSTTRPMTALSIHFHGGLQTPV